jgi:hypothetical protein
VFVRHGSTLKFTSLESVSEGVVTRILPVAAPAGTVAEMAVGERVVKEAATL